MTEPTLEQLAELLGIPQDGVDVDHGGYLVHPDFATYVMAAAQPGWLAELFPPPTWEQRLAWAVEQRSIRSRFRRARATLRYRIPTAIDVLVGRHSCDDLD